MVVCEGWAALNAITPSSKPESFSNKNPKSKPSDVVALGISVLYARHKAACEVFKLLPPLGYRYLLPDRYAYLPEMFVRR